MKTMSSEKIAIITLSISFLFFIFMAPIKEHWQKEQEKIAIQNGLQQCEINGKVLWRRTCEI